MSKIRSSSSPSRPVSRRGASRPRQGWLALLGLLASAATASIPATPVMTLYRFNGDFELPYFELESFGRQGATSPAGTLVQGTTLIPCLPIRSTGALTDEKGTPFVGFEIVVDPRTATPDATTKVREAIARRKALTVGNHHCGPGVRHVVDVRNLYAMEKPPFFDPPGGGRGRSAAGGGPDGIVRAFHDSAQCAQANARLTQRRQALAAAWERFSRENPGRWPASELAKARQLDYTMRTALFEGHLQRGCNAYGACERNIVALSIRNRALERCFGREGCRTRGDFEGVASTVAQYNIWDEYLTQISGLTACFLRDDLATQDYYARLQAMYEQNVGDVQRILFGTDTDLAEIFPGAALADIESTAHYYHAPAMGKCFPQYERVEYMAGAVARRGSDFALIANTRIQIGEKVGDDYRFRSFHFEETDTRDVVDIRDDYPGFVVDGRKVTLEQPSGCRPYGVPAGCPRGDVGRYRRTPSWLDAGKPLGLTCRIADRAEQCDAQARLVTVQVGGACDTQMRPVAGVH
jgi:hypothetical protein